MTAKTQGATAAFLERIGTEIRRRRKLAGLTVEELARASQVSRRMLTQIELGQANPSLVTVDKVARALGTHFADLTQDSTADPVSVRQPGEAAGVWSSSSGSAATLQVATTHLPVAELWDWCLEPGDRYDASPDATGSQELFHILEGELTLIGDGFEAVRIPAGGSARLASDRTYAYLNEGDVAVRFVRVVQLGG